MGVRQRTLESVVMTLFGDAYRELIIAYRDGAPLSTVRYSRMCLAGLSNDSPRIPSITIWCDSPMPRVRRPPVAAWVDSACPASIMGWRG